MERKCPQCGTWNTDNDHCTSCNATLNPELARQEAHDAREEKAANRPPDKLDILHDKMENSRWLIVRIIYRILYAVWTVFIAIVSFFMWMIAAGPG